MRVNSTSDEQQQMKHFIINLKNNNKVDPYCFLGIMRVSSSHMLLIKYIDSIILTECDYLDKSTQCQGGLASAMISEERVLGIFPNDLESIILQ